MIFLEAVGKRGLVKEMRGSSGTKAALHISLHRTQKKCVAPYKPPSIEKLQAPA